MMKPLVIRVIQIHMYIFPTGGILIIWVCMKWFCAVAILFVACDAGADSKFGFFDLGTAFIKFAYRWESR